MEGGFLPARNSSIFTTEYNYEHAFLLLSQTDISPSRPWFMGIHFQSTSHRSFCRKTLRHRVARSDHRCDGRISTPSTGHDGDQSLVRSSPQDRSACRLCMDRNIQRDHIRRLIRFDTLRVRISVISGRSGRSGLRLAFVAG